MPEPKWKAEWDRLTEGKPYLEIKNWKKYQPDMEDGTSNPWFKSYSNTDEDEVAEPSMVRWAKDALRRARARRGGPLVCDMRGLMMSTSCHINDRHSFPHTVLTLLSQRFLIPCNESFTPKSRGEEKKGKESSLPTNTNQSETGKKPMKTFSLRD
jgi:hypothetical protein